MTEHHQPTPESAAHDHYKPPFANCSFKMCDLPGQCRGEGKCHHPAKAPVSDQAPQQPASAADGLPVSTQEKEEAARYRWLRDRNDWHAEPRLDETDGTVWKLTFYTPAPIIDPSDDDSLDVALIAAMLADASGCRPRPPVKQPLSVQPSGNAGELPKAIITLSGAQLLQALDYISPDRDTDPSQLESEASISYGDGHSGKGYYCWECDYPEEGAILLDAEAPDAQAQPPVSESLPYEQALFELIDKIEPGLDTGDLLADAATASKALSARQTSGTALWVEQVDITDIPDAVLTEAGKQLKASQQASGQDRESRRATKEGEKNAAVDDYFKARTWVMDTTDSRRIFEAGFDCGYDARAAAKGDV